MLRYGTESPDPGSAFAGDAASLAAHGGRSSGRLEHLVVVQDVAGSNPVGRPPRTASRPGPLLDCRAGR
jgi:hypothetical protein